MWQPALVRLAKFLAHSGVASRRAAEKMILAGRVTVSGQIVSDPARDVDESSGVAVDGKPVAPEPLHVYAVNKPRGVVSTAKDTHGRKTVVDMVHSHLRLYPVGRLDANTTGLLLLTNDGELAERLMHPRYGVQKGYRAIVDPKPVSEASLRHLREGVKLEDGMTSPARVRQIEPGVLELRLGEGKKRQVRRMFEAVGHRVLGLERFAFGPLLLDRVGPKGGPLAAGTHRLLSPAEVERLRKAGSGPLEESDT
ncbi:MAG: rRNA synthase [Thermoleophilaceae bacterium]|nr:rRNA synthase [Thermoleophilaceae bacterium]